MSFIKSGDFFFFAHLSTIKNESVVFLFSSSFLRHFFLFPSYVYRSLSLSFFFTSFASPPKTTTSCKRSHSSSNYRLSYSLSHTCARALPLLSSFLLSSSLSFRRCCVCSFWLVFVDRRTRNTYVERKKTVKEGGFASIQQSSFSLHETDNTSQSWWFTLFGKYV